MKMNEFMNLNSFLSFANQKKLAEENADEIYTYFAKVYSASNPPFYHCVPAYNSAVNDNQFKYIVVEFENDSVFFMYKYIQIIKTKQVRVIDVPISLNGIKENEDIVTEKLMSLDFCRFVYKESFANDKLNNSNPQMVEYSDYYFDLSSHKFNDRRVNIVKENDDFEIIISDSILDAEIMPLYEKWVDGMSSNGSTVTSKSIRTYKNVINSKNATSVVIKYKGEAISSQTFIIDKKLGYADSISEIHSSRDGSDDDVLNKVYKRLGGIQSYIAVEYLKSIGIKYLYIAGCRPTEKRLLAHKEAITDGYIKYLIH